MSVTRPAFIYGTAWKEDETERLVRMALEAGFRAIDTANQRKHYFEAGVGAALAKAFADGLVTRDDVWLQTKFTFVAGQDRRLPYDPSAPITTQVQQSFASSLEHLGVERLDSLVLHGPSRRTGVHEDDVEAWRSMEAIHSKGGTRALGVSNVDAAQLAKICEIAAVAPSFVQNRCFAAMGWDAEVRAICRERGIAYQGFSLLTANPHVLQDTQVRAIAKAKRCTPARVIFRFAIDVGMIPLTGTSDPDHAADDLAALDLKLEPEAVRLIERIALG